MSGSGNGIKGALVAVAAVLACLLVSGTVAAAEVTVTEEKRVSDRLIELTVETPAFAEPTKVHVFLPAGYEAEPNRRWPVTYVLAGMQNNYNSFADFLNGEELSRDYPSIMVSPDGNSGFWSDWFNDGSGGPPMYETFVTRQLIDLIDERYRTIAERAQRAVFGISMGGYGATSLAARHPDLFGSVATISGAVDSNDPLIGATISLAPTLDGGAPDAINGPRITEEIRWRGANPTDLAVNLRDLDVQVRTANGILNPGIGEGAESADALSCIVEGGVYQGSINFHDELVRLGVEHLWKDYGNGCHTSENFTREVVDTLVAFKGVFADPTPDPDHFEYKTIEPEFEIWDWQVKADPARALEFMTIEAGTNTVTLTGSGITSVTTPPLYRGLRRVDLGGRTFKPSADGRLRFTADLGPAHTIQQYRFGASEQYSRAAFTFEPHALIRVLKAKRLKRWVRVCARAVGGVIPRARIRAGKRTVLVRLTGKKTCRQLNLKGWPLKVSVKGSDAYGHPAYASRKISRKG